MRVFNKALIFGAGSAIAQELTNILLKNDFSAVLADRNVSRIKKISIRPGYLRSIEFIKGPDYQDNFKYITNLKRILNREDITHIFFCHGFMPSGNYRNSNELIKTYNCNLISNAIALAEIERSKKIKKSLKKIIIIGSIAGDRGKGKNPIYDSSKAALEHLSIGYSQRFIKFGINFLFVKPGNVISPMTAKKNKNLLWVEPNYVARDIWNALNDNKNIIYTPYFWKYIMFFVRLIPEVIFRKLKIGYLN
jgi:decaprenylphospho-beta-D-erythro-pentofuranosid-2-ulose 2-reductase